MSRFNPSTGVYSLSDPPNGGMCDLHGLRIMVVDDVEDARDMIAEILTLCGAKVVGVASVREALQGMEAGVPDALITDISMPQEDGYALIRAVRALAPDKGGNVPAVALTAHASESIRLRVLSAGFQMHLAKPVDLMQLPSQLIGLIRNRPSQH